MKLRSLEAFCAAVEEGSISGAARRMYLTSPSISERLVELEQEVRVSLLTRSRMGVEPTGEGAVLYQRARKVLHEVAILEQTMHRLCERHDRKLRLGACLTLGEHLLPDLFWNFRKKIPEISTEFFLGNDSEVIQAIANKGIPLGLVSSEAHYTLPFDTIPFLDDELVVVVPPDHPWTRREVSAEDLPREPFIAREKGSTTRRIIERTIEEISLKKTTTIELDVQIELGSTTAIKEAIERGCGFSILSRATIQRKLGAGTLKVASGFDIPWKFNLIRHPATVLNSVEQSFYEYLLDVSKIKSTQELSKRWDS